MPKKMTRMRAVNEQFLTRVKPKFENWGLSKHPRSEAYFGSEDHGYRYDFADITDKANIKLASFAIIQPNANLWIRGYKAGKLEGSEQDLQILFDDLKDIYILTRSFSIWRPLSVKFELPYKSKDPPAEQARVLMDDVMKELPKLKKYLYG